MLMQLIGRKNGAVNIIINLRRVSMRFDLLLEQQKSNKKPKEGDIFVLKPKNELFCFGKVIMTNVESRDSFVNGMNLVFIYDHFSENEIIPEDIENYKVLLAEVVNHQLWIKGFAKNVAFSEVNKKEIDTDYAFWDILKNTYVDIKGNPVNSVPQIKGTYGLASYGVIGKEIHKVIVQRGL